MRKFLILLTLLLPLAACNGMLPKKQTVVPSWVLTSPNDSHEWFWGVGEGQDLDTAKRAGLKDIAGKLRVSISGQLDSSVTVDNNKVDRQAHTRISEEVQKTEFSNYVVDKTAQSADGFYVLVKVDRQAFVHDLKNKLANLDANIQPVAAALDSKTPLERFIALRRLQPGLDKGVGYAQLLIGADAGDDGAAHLRNYESPATAGEAGPHRRGIPDPGPSRRRRPGCGDGHLAQCKRYPHGSIPGAGQQPPGHLQ